MNQRSETNVEVIVNSFYLILIKFFVPFLTTLQSGKYFLLAVIYAALFGLTIIF